MKKPIRLESANESAKVDWTGVHRRLEIAQDALERALNPSEEVRKRILKARAVFLAREVDGEATKASLEIVTFLLAQEVYGIETRWAAEVCPLRELAPFPSLPQFVLGMINVRGEILPVADLRKYFDLPEKGLTDLNKALIVRSGKLELGILADQVLDIRTVPLDAIQRSLPTLTGIREKYLLGVTGDRVVILDALKVLTDERWSENATVAA